MRRSYLLSLIFLSLGFGAVLRSEMLIFKENEGKLTTLTADDLAKNGNALAALLLKYEWPMCTASQLSLPERDALLSPGAPYAQELFIQNKINEKFTQYRVAYIPTCLYELFVILQLFATKGENNTLQTFIREVMTAKEGTALSHRWNIDIARLINKERDKPQEFIIIRERINGAYRNVNDSVYHGAHSLFFYINNLLTAQLINLYPGLQTITDSQSLSASIKNHSTHLTTFIIDALLSLYDVRNLDKLRLANIDIGYSNRDSIVNLVLSLKKEKESAIVAKVVALEYEAQEQNKGLLLRGTTFEDFPVGLSFPQVGKKKVLAEQKTLAGSTMLREERDPSKRGRESIISTEQAYWQKRNMPYSISFGSSLFAGSLRDADASAYYYLAGKREATIGYAIFIDKKAYYQHHNNNLFFIPPLAPLAAIFERGEFFHPRSKAAIASKKNEQHEVRGVTGFKLKDPAGIILITRDPLLHAQFFSQYLAENGRILQKGDESNLTPEEINFAHEALKSQQEAAQFYENLRTITPVLKRWIEKSRDGKENENNSSN